MTPSDAGSDKRASNVRFTCPDGSFFSGGVFVGDVQIEGVMKAVYTLEGRNLGRLVLTIEGVTADLSALPEEVIATVIEVKRCDGCQGGAS